MNSIDHWNEVILPATDLFIPPEDYYYVVLANNWKDKYESVKNSDTRYSRIKPLFVDCPEGHFGESPCCKQEKGLLQFHDEILNDVTRTNIPPHHEHMTRVMPSFIGCTIFQLFGFELVTTDIGVVI